MLLAFIAKAMNTFNKHAGWQTVIQHCLRRAKFTFLILAAAVLQLCSVAACAHASLIESLPADASVLGAAPAEVVLHFNEAVAPLVFKLVAPDGAIQPLNRIAVIPDGLNITLPPAGAAGTYMLSWRVISADGHPVGGALSYSIGSRSATAESVVSSSAPMLTAVIWLARFGLYVALFLSIGGLAFRAWFAADADTDKPSRWINTLLCASWLLLPLAVGTHGLDALSASWDQLLSWAPWKTSLGTSYGITAVLMLAASLCAYIGNLNKRSRPIASVIALCLLAAAFACSGHASTAPPTWLARPVVWLHVLAICLWTGSLLPLMFLIHKAQGPQVLHRFSRIIPWVLALLLASGVILTTLQLRHVNELWLSDYGKILSVKLMLLSALLVVAAFNRYALTAGAGRGEPRAILWMKRLIALEVMLVLLILAAATTWRFTPPPRAQAPALTVASHLHIHTPEAMADITLLPHSNRQVEAQVFLANGEGSPLTAKEVLLKLSSPQQGLEPLEVPMQLGDKLTWQTKAFALPATGHWHVRLEILISDFESISLDGEMQ